jgi:hypothetical protein
MVVGLGFKPSSQSFLLQLKQITQNSGPHMGFEFGINWGNLNLNLNFNSN